MKFKYPRTPHMAFSQGATSDDRILRSLDDFLGHEVVFTMKMDGENTTLYRDGFHARSLDSRHHPSRDWLARFHGQIAHEIPDGWRVCGENLYARHSIEYEDLPSYFMGFSVWNDRNVALSWQESHEFMECLGIVPVPEIAALSGVFDAQTPARIQAFLKTLDTEKNEGLVMRFAGEIAYADFGRSFAKWVRKGHVQTEEHWMHQAVVPNGLALAQAKNAPHACMK